MRRTPYAALATALLLTLAGCSGDGDGDAAAETTPTPAVYAGCEDVVDQQPAVEFEPAAGTKQTVDALMGRNVNAAGAPCVDVFVWDVTEGWELDHYEITADHGGGMEASVRSTSDDFIEALRFTPLMSCADVHGELVYRKVGDPDAKRARFVASSRVCSGRDQG
jgi:hypothetical protein